jgi:hypothetical protein
MSALLGLDLYEAAMMHQAELRDAAPIVADATTPDVAMSEIERASWTPARSASRSSRGAAARPCLFRLLWAAR